MDQEEVERLQYLGYKMIADWSMSLFKEMLGSWGTYRTLEAVRPYSKHAGMAAYHNAINRFSLVPGSLESASFPLVMVGGLVCDGDYDKIEIREQGAVSDVTACPWKAAPPEICVALSHFGAEGICDAAGKDLRIIFTQHLIEGAPSCQAIYTMNKKVEKIADLGPTVRVLPRIILSLEEAAALTTNVRLSVWSNISNAFNDLFGVDLSKQKLDSIMETNGRIAGDVLSDGCDKGNVLLLPFLMKNLHLAMKQSATIVEENGEWRGEVTSCPINDNAPEVCAQFESICNGLCHGVDGNLEFRYTSQMSNGDKSCHWAIKKKTDNKRDNPSDIQGDDPSRILAIRYAKGELSENEFESKMAMLTKHGIVK